MPELLRKKEEEEKRQRVAQRMQRQLNSIITDESGGYGRCAEAFPHHYHRTVCSTDAGLLGQDCAVKIFFVEQQSAHRIVLEQLKSCVSLQQSASAQLPRCVGMQGAAGTEADRLRRQRL